MVCLTCAALPASQSSTYSPPSPLDASEPHHVASPIACSAPIAMPDLVSASLTPFSAGASASLLAAASSNDPPVVPAISLALSSDCAEEQVSCTNISCRCACILCRCVSISRAHLLQRPSAPEGIPPSEGHLVIVSSPSKHCPANHNTTPLPPSHLAGMRMCSTVWPFVLTTSQEEQQHTAKSLSTPKHTKKKKKSAGSSGKKDKSAQRSSEIPHEVPNFRETFVMHLTYQQLKASRSMEEEKDSSNAPPAPTETEVESDAPASKHHASHHRVLPSPAKGTDPSPLPFVIALLMRPRRTREQEPEREGADLEAQGTRTDHQDRQRTTSRFLARTIDISFNLYLK